MCGVDFVFGGNMVEHCRSSYSNMYCICNLYAYVDDQCSLFTILFAVLATAVQFKAVYASV